MTDRRTFVSIAGCTMLSLPLRAFSLLKEPFQDGPAHTPLTKERWLATATDAANSERLRKTDGQVLFGRFVERIYYLAGPLYWKPTPGLLEQQGYPEVTVPVGFVTDLASIPRVFYSVLPPDGPYTVPAVIHDYLYWTQTTTKAQADSILNFSMQDFKIDTPTRQTIYQAVHMRGMSAWQEDARVKATGEKRILTRFPQDPTTRWQDWKKNPTNFA